MPNSVDWVDTTVGAVLSLDYGKGLVEESRTGTGYPVFGSSGEVGRHTNALVAGPGIVVGRKGTVGSVIWSDQPFWPIDTTYFVRRLSEVDLRWLFWRLSTLNFGALDSSTGVPGLNRNDAYRLSFRLPPEAEQHLIAAILDTLDDAIGRTEQVIAKLHKMNQGLLQDLLTSGVDKSGGLRPMPKKAPQLYKDSPLGPVPKGWTTDTVQNVLLRIIDYRGRTPRKTENGVPLITAKNVRMGFVDSEPREFIATDAYAGWMTRGIPSDSDVLFTTEAPLGNVAQVGTTDRVAFAQRVIILQTTPRLLPAFLKYRLMSDDFRKAVVGRASGTTALGIKQSEFRKVLLSYPVEIQEQRAIVSVLAQVEERVHREQTVLAKLLSQKRGLLHDLLMGRVRVPLSAGTTA